MQIANLASGATVLRELGERLARQRLERNLTQRDLAHEAGVSARTISLIETGRSITLGSLVRILRALGILDSLNQMLPASGPSPIEELERGGKRRERASRPRRPDENAGGSAEGTRR
jgi:transcriptional regulator with XRE-family HTH domain